MSVLKGIRIVEFEGLGPGPFCGMLLADLGADVVLIARAGAAATGALFNRGKRVLPLDLKNPNHVAAAVRLSATADATIEGLRPGVMERLGLGPDVLLAANPRLVYGRITGWGQTGPLAPVAGHDLNYASLSGAAWYAGQAGAAPAPPPTIVGDIGGGALYLAIGILAGVLKARETGTGSVVDAAIVDGAAHMLGLIMSLRAAGGFPDERGRSMLDGADFYDVYQCADGKWISIGPLEPKFYALLIEKLGLQSDARFAAQFDQPLWPERKTVLRAMFAERPSSHWRALLEGADVCFAPVLTPAEAREHPHMKARAIWREIGGVLQAGAAPRFDGQTPPDPRPVAASQADADAILKEAGLTRADLG
ncbi:MAG: CaiB/BaiF CoA-transferase family protein [Parvularculaceae bacterium]|nr:CaiB/BaiF CoA-transferase family protein [Parvularculaceae bacterium]